MKITIAVLINLTAEDLDAVRAAMLRAGPERDVRRFLTTTAARAVTRAVGELIATGAPPPVRAGDAGDDAGRDPGPDPISP